MKFRYILSFVILAALAASGQDLGTAFGHAEQIIRDSKPTSGGVSERARNDREDRRTSGGSQSTQPDWGAIRRAEKERERELKREEKERQRQAEERERQRVEKNLSIIEANLAAAAAAGGMPPMPPHSYDVDKSTDTFAVQGRRDWLQTLMKGPPLRPIGSYASEEKRQAFRNSQVVRDATRRGEKPPFQPLWDFYEFNRSIAAGLVPDENRCAIVMSMTLGLEPQGDDASVASLTDKKEKSILLGLISTKKLEEPVRNPAATHTEVAARYYLRADDLAKRLTTEWGAPREIDALDAAKYLNGKQGVVFLEHAYLHPGTPTSHPQGSYLEDPFKNFRKGDHIDLWKSNMNATDSSMPFQHAQKVWFWELK
jgi:type VI secretion system (T6SS) effector Tae4 (amidase)